MFRCKSGEVSKRTSLSVDAIRFYERSSLLPALPRTVGRFRLYTDNDVARLSFIQKMQSLGFSLREVRQILDIRDNRLDPCKEVSQLVKTKLTGLSAAWPARLFVCSVGLRCRVPTRKALGEYSSRLRLFSCSSHSRN